MKFKELKAIWRKYQECKDLFKYTTHSCFYVNDSQVYGDTRICVLFSDILKVMPNFNQNIAASKYIQVTDIISIPSYPDTLLEDTDVYIETDTQNSFFLGKCVVKNRIGEKVYTPIEKFEIKTLVTKDRDFREEHGLMNQRPYLSIIYKTTELDAAKRYKFDPDANNIQFLIAGIAFADLIVLDDGRININKRISTPSCRIFMPRFDDVSDAQFFKYAIRDALETGVLEVKTFNNED
jgi:hypothetical protein